MIITDLSCLEVISAADDVVGGQVIVSPRQRNRSSVRQEISSGGDNTGDIFNDNFTSQTNTMGDITATSGPAAPAV